MDVHRPRSSTKLSFLARRYIAQPSVHAYLPNCYRPSTSFAVEKTWLTIPNRASTTFPEVKVGLASIYRPSVGFLAVKTVLPTFYSPSTVQCPGGTCFEISCPLDILLRSEVFRGYSMSWGDLISWWTLFATCFKRIYSASSLRQQAVHLHSGKRQLVHNGRPCACVEGCVVYVPALKCQFMHFRGPFTCVMERLVLVHARKLHLTSN